MLVIICQFLILSIPAQTDSSILSLDRIYSTSEFQVKRMPSFQWISGGEEYIILEDAEGRKGQDIAIYNTLDGNKRSIFSDVHEASLSEIDKIRIEAISLSDDESKVLMFYDSKRVWRSNTKGKYKIFNRSALRESRENRGRFIKSFFDLGSGLPKSSLMFAKFSPANDKIAYVSGFNIYVEDYLTGEIKRLTNDGNGAIINGTFDWAYEEEFGCRDGFRWSPDGERIAYWQLNASNIGTHYMINNTDSIYPKLIPLQYPKVGEDPSSCRAGLVNIRSGITEWIDVPGDPVQNYLPRMQWIRDDLLLIQQINRKQNHLIYWNYNPRTKEIRKVYEEREDTWVDIDYPDVSSRGWGMRDLSLIDDIWVTRMTEGDGWRHVYKINLDTGEKILLTPGDYDVATTCGHDNVNFYFAASPSNSTQRYLYKTSLEGGQQAIRSTPRSYPGINVYNISPNGKYAFHSHRSIHAPMSTHLIKTENHKVIRTMIDNSALKDEVDKLYLGTIDFFKITTEDSIEIDGRIVFPPDFDPSKKYPVLFHVYGEPWGQVAQDTWIGMWDRYISQLGYVIIDMDNRGTPCLKGSEWRKSIYRKIGIINANDQAAAARAALEKFDFLDPSRTAVWGWSGGGSMTLNLMFRFPEIYTTGISVAPVGNQLLYDNIYQERYMGLPSENREDFIKGSPVTYAQNLEGNLLLIHGTGDDNVHYQNAEVVINKLIQHNRAFDMMAYPNRSHGIWEGENTRKHLYGLITRYLTEHVPPGPRGEEIKP